MITTIVLAGQLTKSLEPADATSLRAGELVRLYERTMSRAGTYQTLIALTPTKAFFKTREWANTVSLSAEQQAILKASLRSESLRSLVAAKRENPMWPSAYDATDQWMAYRVGSTKFKWTNHDYEYPGEKCSLTKLIEELRAQATPR